MNKAELMKELSNKTNLSQAQCSQVITAYVEIVEEVLSKGESLQIIGFGNFSVSETKEREGRNPSTGKAMTIPAGKRVKFSVGKQLKDAISNVKSKNAKKDVKKEVAKKK